ncbi:MAG: hypothetical protein LLG40_13960 [Deltaproteobacteria bacterium]|nr:hypothetical protein [Deltaproteobacteria bacterium]
MNHNLSYLTTNYARDKMVEEYYDSDKCSICGQARHLHSATKNCPDGDPYAYGVERKYKETVFTI